MTSARVLVVDDNRDLANGIAMVLRDAELETQVAYSAKRALTIMEASPFDVVLSDMRMPAMSGLELLKQIRASFPTTQVVLLTAYGTIDSAVDAMKLGALDYLTKPFDNDALVEVVRRAVAAAGTSNDGEAAAVVGEVAEALSAEDLLPGLSKALGALVRATGADDGEIFLREPEGQDLLLAVCSGPDRDLLTDRVRFTQGLGYPGVVAATGRPLCTQGGLADDPRYLRSAVTRAGIQSLVAVPLPDAGSALGSIQLMSRQRDFPVDRVREVLERAAAPISNAVRAGLALLRQSVDTIFRDADATAEPLQLLLESMRQVAGARHGTLALIDPHTGGAERVVSIGPTSFVCAYAEAGAWKLCPSLATAHGVALSPGRRQWPEACRRGLPRRAASPCCLPVTAGGHTHGVVVLDFGREGAENATGRLVPLLSMAQQAAIRFQSYRAGLAVAQDLEDSVTASAAPAAPELELRCLGPFAALRRGQPIAAAAFTRSKALVLLKLLALKGGAPVNRDVLIEQLWPMVEPQLGANRLHGVVHDLRSVIEPRWVEREWRYVRNRGELYFLDLQAPIELDLVRFRLLVEQGLRVNLQEEEASIACLEQALELYRGVLFEDEPYADWCTVERDELNETHLRVLERLAELHAGQGHPEKALGILRRASRASPFRDDLILTQMQLLAGLARPTEALAIYEAYRRALRDELEAEPSSAVHAFQQHLLRTTG